MSERVAYTQGEGRPTFKALEGFKDLNESCGGELLMVLGRDFHTHLTEKTRIIQPHAHTHTHRHLQVLSDVGLKHGTQTLHGILHRQRPKVVDQPVRVEHVCVHDRSFDVVDVRVVFECSL